MFGVVQDLPHALRGLVEAQFGLEEEDDVVFDVEVIRIEPLRLFNVAPSLLEAATLGVDLSQTQSVNRITRLDLRQTLVLFARLRIVARTQEAVGVHSAIRYLVAAVRPRVFQQLAIDLCSVIKSSDFFVSPGERLQVTAIPAFGLNHLLKGRDRLLRLA